MNRLNLHRQDPKHLVVVTHNPIRTGGMQKFSRFIVNAFLTTDWRVTIALSGENIYSDLQEPFPQHLSIEPTEWIDHRLAGDREYHWRRINQRARWFRHRQPDAALFIQSSNTPFRASVVGAKSAGIPTIVTHRTMPWIKDFVPPGRHFFGLVTGLGLHNRKMIRCTMRVARAADRIVYNSWQVRRCYEHIYNYPRDKGYVIHNALDARLLQQPLTSTEHPDNKNTVTIGYAGRLGAEKQLNVLLHAVAQLRDRSGVRLLIFGQGPERENLARLADELGITHCLQWQKPIDNVRKIYQPMDIVCLPSRRESSSNMITEAMAAGKAVIVSAVGGLPELVDHGSAGLVVPPGDPAHLSRAINNLINNPAQCKTLGQKARQRALRIHDPSLISQYWYGLFTELIESKQPANNTNDTDLVGCPWQTPFLDRELEIASN